MSELFEAVPNISEGRDQSVISACASAITRHARLVHQTSDPVHHRSVFTYFGDADAVAAASIALMAIAHTSIDMRIHRGTHPRIGALDVMPFIPIGSSTMAAASELAIRVGESIWKQFSVPVFFYDHVTTGHPPRTLPQVRRGEFEGLSGRFAELPPDVGDLWGHEHSGAVAIGARYPLVAFNVVLQTGQLSLARRIAASIRESSGGLRSLRALGLELGDGRTQVSLNFTDVSATPLALVIELIRRAAAREGVELAGCELIGLVPRAALAAQAATACGFA